MANENPKTTATTAKVTKVTFNIPTSELEELKQYAKSNNISMTSAI